MNPTGGENILTLTADMRREIDELKSAQRVGPDSLVVNTYATSALVDAGATIAAGGTTNLYVEFQTGRQSFPLITLDVYVYLDSDATQLALLPMQIEQRLVTTPGLAAWDATVDNPDDFNAATFYFKVTAVALDTGTFS